MAEIVVALDVAPVEKALRLVDSLPSLSWVKIGPMLFVRDGPRVMAELKARGVKIFLDLKWHDIPHAVAGAAEAAAAAGVDLATVHALGGSEMMRAAVDVAGAMRLVAVTVLTSHTDETYRSTVGRSDGVGVRDEVIRLTQLALSSGVGGVVASPLEIERIRGLVSPKEWIVVPGIRSLGADPGDQRRTASARDAARAGATHLVVGRPITRAPDPAAAYAAMLEAAC